VSWLGGILGALFKGLFGTALDWLRERRAEAAHREAGQAEQKAADQAAALDAHRRMDEAASRPRDTQSDLNGGRF